MYLLFDCNNFFASCEQVFRPDWRRRPLVVLSNNDGCVVSRSPEAKAIGIAMCEPYFKCRERLEKANGIVCSSNFALYADLSDRIMSILDDALPNLQQYSIDEAFAHVGPAQNCDWPALGWQLRRRILRWTGIAVSVGYAPTKTLAKLANESAKKDASSGGFVSLAEEAQWQPLLEKTPVGEVWGVGRRLAPRMNALGIRTAAGLASSSLDWLRRNFGVQGERLALELRGISCLEQEIPARRTQLMVSRSLKEGISDLAELRALLCRFVEKAARMLREEGLLASQIFVILRTSRFEEVGKLYADGQGMSLPCPSDDTRLFCRAAAALLERIFVPGYPFRKLGVMLAALQSNDSVQGSFEHPQIGPSPLMGVLDRLQKAGHSIHFASAARKAAWSSSMQSPAYTSRWEDIPKAH